MGISAQQRIAHATERLSVIVDITDDDDIHCRYEYGGVGCHAMHLEKVFAAIDGATCYRPHELLAEALATLLLDITSDNDDFGSWEEIRTRLRDVLDRGEMHPSLRNLKK